MIDTTKLTICAMIRSANAQLKLAKIFDFPLCRLSIRVVYPLSFNTSVRLRSPDTTQDSGPPWRPAKTSARGGGWRHDPKQLPAPAPWRRTAPRRCVHGRAAWRRGHTDPRRHQVREGHAGRALNEALRQRKAEALVLAGQNRYIGNAVKGEQFGLGQIPADAHERGAVSRAISSRIG